MRKVFVSRSDKVHYPRIQPASDGPRPMWSVMIPAYESAEYLAKTLRSVLAQDPGPEAMQIEVVDDHSPKEDLGAVVQQIGKGRVSYYRKPANAGPIANFNTCIERSRGEWVHILHADDLVLPGFYDNLARTIATPHIGAAFCRCFWMDEDDHWTGISRLEARSAQVIPRWVDKIAVENHIPAPSIVVRRQAYEDLGGFDSRLPHTADWDMWKRIASSYPIWYEPAVLASYRVHSKSDTSRLMRTGANIQDIRRSIEFSRAYLPGADAERLTSLARVACANYAVATAKQMLRRGDISAAVAQSREALRTSCSVRLLIRIAKMALRDSVSRVLQTDRSPQS
jgi:glycosyltransferase involved in cell wall biosynthesis